jgi:hypothetical protein
VKKKYTSKEEYNAARRALHAANPEFNRLRGRQFYAAHRDSCIQRTKRYAKLNPQKVKFTKIKQVYGLSEEEYNELLRQQNGNCALCQQFAKLTIDHCHKTGRIRGLLCMKCNVSLGGLGDDICGLERAIIYLKNVK